MTAVINNLAGKFIPSSLPPADAFAGQIILVTGGTSGLGVAAAVHFLNLGAQEIIITARKASSPRAEEAKRSILAQAKRKTTEKKGEVTVMELDMNSYDSCVKLVDSLEKSYAGGLDAVVLNAGAMNSVFVESPEGL